MSQRLRVILLTLALMAAAICVYFGSLDNGFIWDDPIILEQQIMAFKTVGDLFVPPLGIPQFGTYYYRPIVVGSFVVDRWFTGPRPMDLPRGSLNPFHLSVVLSHAVVCALLFWFGRVLFRGQPGGLWAAWIGSLLFAVHPILTESVCWMAGRADVMAAIGVIPALGLFVYGRQTGSRMAFVAAAACALFGLLCKETAIAVILALPFLDRIPAGVAAPAPQASQGRDKAGRKTHGRAVADPKALRSAAGWGWRWLPMLATVFVYWNLRKMDLGRGDRGHGPSSLLVSVDLKMQEARIGDWIGDLVGAIGFYVRKAFVPLPLNAFVADVPKDRPTLAVGAIALAASVFFVGFWIRRRESIAPALVAIFFTMLAPSLAIATYSISETPVAERYLYIPIIAVCLGVAYAGLRAIGAVRSRRGEAAARGLAIGLAGAAAVLTVWFAWVVAVRNEVWRDDEAFWGDAVAKASHQGLPHLHLGLAYDKHNPPDRVEREKWDRMAEEQFQIALDPTRTVYDVEGRSTALNNLANVYLGRGEYARSEENFRKAIAMRPDYHTPYYGMSLVNYRRALDAQQAKNSSEAWARMREAEEWATRAVGLNRNYTKAYLLLGSIQVALGNDLRGKESLERVVQLEPGSALGVQAESILKEVRQRLASGTARAPGADAQGSP